MDSPDRKTLKILLLCAGLMLCLAVVPILPYGYYMLLRLVVCGVSGYAAYSLNRDAALNRHLVPLVILAVLFNPVLPVHLSQLFWLPIDLGTAVYFLQLSKKL